MRDRNKKTTAVDWSEVRRRLEKARSTLEQGWTPDSEKKKRILRARAKALAKEAEKREAEKEGIKVLEFLLASERYAIESSYIREVYPLKDITPLPGAPPFAAGIINVRGQILPVIDIKQFFDLPEKGLGDLNKIIILRSSAMELGILADVIGGIREIRLGDLQPSLPTLTGIREDYLKGVTGDRLIVLDASKMLSDKRIVVHEEV